MPWSGVPNSRRLAEGVSVDFESGDDAGPTLAGHRSGEAGELVSGRGQLHGTLLITQLPNSRKGFAFQRAGRARRFQCRHGEFSVEKSS